MPSSIYDVFLFQPDAERPHFETGDPPARFPQQLLSHNLLQQLNNHTVRKRTDLSENCKARTSPSGRHYYVDGETKQVLSTRSELTSSVRSEVKEVVSTPAPDDGLSVLELFTPTSVFQHDRESDALQATEPGDSSILSTPQIFSFQEDEGHAGISPGESHAGTNLDRIANQNSSLLAAKIPYKEEGSGLAGQICSSKAALSPFSRSSALSELRRLESSASGITGVDTPDDLSVYDVTDPNSYPSLLCVGLEDGQTEFEKDILSNDKVGDWLSTPVAQSPSIRLTFIPTVTNANAMYISPHTWYQLINRFNLPPYLAMYSHVPLQGTYNFKIPLENGDFVIHCRSAISISSSTILTYRYYRESQSIRGFVMDHKERSDMFVRKLDSLASKLGPSILPLVALALHGVEAASEDATLSEDRYYLEKAITNVLLAAKRREGDMRSLFDQKHKWASERDGLITCRKLQAEATNELLRFLRSDWQEKEPSLAPILAMIQSVNAGHCHIIQRQQDRANTLHSSYTEWLQFQNSQESLQISEAQREIAEAAQKTLIGTNAILQSIRSVAESQREIAAIAQQTSIATYSTLASINDLAESNRILSISASRDGKLLVIITSITMLFLPAAAFAEIFQLTRLPVKIYAIVVIAITFLLCIVTFGYYGWTAKSKLPEPREDAGGERARGVAVTVNPNAVLHKLEDKSADAPTSITSVLMQADRLEEVNMDMNIDKTVLQSTNSPSSHEGKPSCKANEDKRKSCDVLDWTLAAKLQAELFIEMHSPAPAIGTMNTEDLQNIFAMRRG